MNTVLVVDDDPLFLTFLEKGLYKYVDNINVITANNGKEAIKYLSKEDVELVVTDLKMPEVDGFQLLAHVMNNHRGLPVIVMTAFGTPEIKEDAFARGSIGYIEKPIDLKVLSEAVEEGLSRATRGHLKGINLVDFLQLLKLEQKTCTLHVCNKNRVSNVYLTSNIYLEKGELLNVELGDLDGEAAAYQVLNWRSVELEIDNKCHNKKRVIHLPIDEILLNAAKWQDEYIYNTGSYPTYKPIEIPEEQPEESVTCGISTATEKIKDDIRALWQKNSTHLSNLSNSAFVVAVIIPSREFILLRGNSDGNDQASTILAQYETILHICDYSPEGVFEYVNDNTGIGIVWNIAQQILILYGNLLKTKSEVAWFRGDLNIIRRALTNLE